MKRKLLAVIAFSIVIAMVFSGCSLIRPNAEREANQVLATIKADGITLYITQLEFSDYLNSNGQSVFQQFELEEGIQYLLDKKIESKYITIKAMSELKKYPHRKSVTRNWANPQKPEDALTWGEYYFAIKSVNDEIQSTIDNFVEEYEQSEIAQRIAEIDREDIEKIEFVEDSFETEYYQGQKVDLTGIRFRIIYTEESGKEAIEEVITEAMYSEDAKFSTEEPGEKTVAITFDKKVVVDEEDTFEELTAEYEYNVIATRPTKDKPEEEELEIPLRYRDSFASNEIYAFFSLDTPNNATTAESEAYRRLRTNLKNQNRSIESLYQSAFESSVLSALNFELSEAVAPIDATKIEQEYEYLIRTNKEAYEGLANDKAKADKFAEAISSNLESVYYFPKVENIEGYFYVQQILFNFSEEQKTFLDANKGPNELDNANKWAIKGEEKGKSSLFYLIGESITTKESNPDYDPEDEDSYPFARDNDGNIVERDLFGTGGIYAELQAALSGAASAAEKLQIFDNYKYMYNDDPGIMNNEVGYLIPPEGVRSNFYASFVELGRALYDADPTIGNALIDGTLAYCYTDYGVHILMISMMPFSEVELENGGSFDIDYELDLKGTTLEKIIKDKLEEQAKNKAYENFAKAYIDNAKDAATVDTKKINKIIKRLKG